MNGPIMIGLGLAVLAWGAFTLFEGLWLGGAALVALGAVMIGWGMKQKGQGE